MAMPSRQSTGGLANRGLLSHGNTQGLRRVTREEMITSGRLRQSSAMSTVTPRKLSAGLISDMTIDRGRPDRQVPLRGVLSLGVLSLYQAEDANTAVDASVASLVTLPGPRVGEDDDITADIVTNPDMHVKQDLADPQWRQFAASDLEENFKDMQASNTPRSELTQDAPTDPGAELALDQMNVDD